MTTGRINQVASALPRASSPAGRAPSRRRGVAFRRRCGGGEGRGGKGGCASRTNPGRLLLLPRPLPSPPPRRLPRPAAGGRRGVPPRRPSGRDPPCPTEFAGAPRGAVDVPGRCLARPRPERFRGGAPDQAALREDGRAPRGSGSEASGHRSSKPFRRGGDGRRRPAARGPPGGCSGGIARVPPAAARAAAWPRAPQQETKQAGRTGQPAAPSGGRFPPSP